MFVIDAQTRSNRPVKIEKIDGADLRSITKKKFFFNWRVLDQNSIYKLCIEAETEILGLIAIKYFDSEFRVEILLLATSYENVGSNKKFNRIAGNLIAFAARLALKRYGHMSAVSLVPKTELRVHYMNNYGFEPAGKSLFLEGKTLQTLITEYEL